MISKVHLLFFVSIGGRMKEASVRHVFSTDMQIVERTLLKLLSSAINSKEPAFALEQVNRASGMIDTLRIQCILSDEALAKYDTMERNTRKILENQQELQKSPSQF